MTHPFARYFSSRENSSYMPREIFRPEIDFREGDHSLTAHYGKNNRRSLKIYSLRDVISHQGKLKSAHTNFKGLIGERLLSVVLEELIDETLHDLRKENPEEDIAGKVLLEPKKHEGTGVIMRSRDPYILRFKSKSTALVLKESPIETEYSMYNMEKMAMHTREVDGLGCIHLPSIKYLLVGEVKTMSSWDNIDGKEFERKIIEDLFTPFRILYPEHEFIFAFMAEEGRLFRKGQLNKVPHNIAERLESEGIGTIFLPIPQTPRPIQEYADRMHDMLPLVRKIMTTISYDENTNGGNGG